MVNLFVLSANLKENARLLDNSRLGKQRLETKQIINTLEGNSEAWSNHPATLSWRGYVPALKIYYNFIVREWISRGFVNNMELYPVNEKYYIVPLFFDWITTVFYEEKQEDDENSKEIKSMQQINNSKKYTPIKSYKPSGKFVYSEDLLNRIENKLN